MKLVCFEGSSGAGKTTQFHKITEQLKTTDIRFLATAEKNYEPFKTAVSDWHKYRGPDVPFTSEDIRMFAEARAETFRRNFLGLSDELDLLILDRYFYTSAIHQRNSGLSSQEILQINIASGAPIPDLAFLLDADADLCFQRSVDRNQKTGGRHLFSTTAHKTREMRDAYLELMSSRSEVRVIPAYLPVLEVNGIIIGHLDKLLYPKKVSK